MHSLPTARPRQAQVVLGAGCCIKHEVDMMEVPPLGPEGDCRKTVQGWPGKADEFRYMT